MDKPQREDGKPIKKAVALRYNETDSAPVVVAKGKGVVADNIIRRADTHQVKTYQDAELVDELTQIDLGLNIPSELYHAVAGVLLFIGDLDKRGVR